MKRSVSRCIVIAADIVQVTLRLDDLPASALEAAAVFHARWARRAEQELAGEAQSLALVFQTATPDHNHWRRAVIADLARAAAPKRVNGVAGDDQAAIRTTLQWLEQAPGITGQLLPIDGASAQIRA